MAQNRPTDVGTPALSARNVPSPQKRIRNRRLLVERLEGRLLMAADPFAELLSHGGMCNCPICSGQGLETVAPELAEVTSTATTFSPATTIAGVPQLSSRPGATATLYLDFDGHTEAVWGEHTNVRTWAFDRDGNAGSFSGSEISSIQEIWARVAEDYAPYNINVTTVQPPSFANRAAVRIAIGGNWDDWFGHSAGGVAYVGGFYNGASNVGYVFSDALGNGTPRYVAEAASHEAGHTFGLSHQATWSGGTLTEEYNRGNSWWAPIMGVGYYSARTTWHNGATNSAANAWQDDMSILANSSNGFGYVGDDFGSTVSTASSLPIAGSSVNVAGLIGRNGDADVFRFSTGGGSVSFSLAVAQVGANLDGMLELLNSAGQSILVANPATSLGASLTTALASGTYFLVARASGGYGNVGAYRLTGSVPGATQTPEIAVDIGGMSVADSGALSFGTTMIGTPVTRTITVRNVGGGILSLGQVGGVPAGYSLVTNIPLGTKLAAGQSTSFTVRLNASTSGNFGGGIGFTCSDSNEGTYNLSLSGAVTAAAATPVVRYLDNGSAGFTTSGVWYRQSNLGRESDIQFALRGTGSSVATWNFTGLEAGQYRVSATWPGSTLYASNAPFSIYNGAQRLSTVVVNQERASSTFSDAGSRWQNLGTFTITGSTLAVRLTNAANERVVADGIRIERVYSTSAGILSRGASLDPAALLLTTAGGERDALPAASPSTSPAAVTTVSNQRVEAVERLAQTDSRPVSAREILFAEAGEFSVDADVISEAADLLHDLLGGPAKAA